MHPELSGNSATSEPLPLLFQQQQLSPLQHAIHDEECFRHMKVQVFAATGCNDTQQGRAGCQFSVANMRRAHLQAQHMQREGLSPCHLVQLARAG